MKLAPVRPTLALADAAAITWDALVVGAGPAGAMAARELALAGAQVLLVDKAAFPRPKVCGCCLNAASLATLDAVGLGDLTSSLGARPISSISLRGRHARAAIPLPGGAAISRTVFDAALAAEAVRAGVAFLPSTFAVLLDPGTALRTVLLRQPGLETRLTARTVIAADGLGGRFRAAGTPHENAAVRNSRMGCGTILPRTPASITPGTIHMACGRGGYVGLVALEDDRLDIAAALDPAFVRRAGGPSNAAAVILAETGFDAIPDLPDADWRGTPALTRRPDRIADERLFAIGDAAGYVEPFTGEGIAWALASGVAVAPLVVRAIHDWRPALADEWTKRHHRLIRRRQATCRFAASLLRHPSASAAALRALARVPCLAAPIVRRLNASWGLTRAATAPLPRSPR